MKVINIRIFDDLEGIDVGNDNIDVFVTTDDGYSYTLSLATPKNLQFLMDKEKMEYYEPGYPFIIVNKLSQENIEEAVKAFAEKDGGYWLKVYHFGGWQGAIDESIFDQLKAKRIEKRKEFDKLYELDGLTEVEEALDKLLYELDGFLNFPRI